MHGQPRKSPKPEDEAASAIRAQKLRSLQSHLLNNHHNKIYTKEAVDLSAKLLETNPESYTAWNYRKVAVEFNLGQLESDSDEIKKILDEELRVVEGALRINFKSYGAWHHRKWVISKGHSSIDHELRLLDKFQKADARNFHAWNYRRFVADLMNRSEDEELKYTTDMINNNFSNYSAWHNRSVLLSHLLQKRVEGYSSKETVLTEEFELVHQAIFTDPDDQSGWFYHLWLLDKMAKSGTPFLATSWPAHGSNLIVSTNNRINDHALFPFTSFHSDRGSFPLVLHFTEAVEGLNPKTVTIEAVFDSNEDLIWTPLSTRKSGAAKVWMTHIKYPDVKLYPLKAYSVKINIGHNRGIISSSGINFRNPQQISFTLSVGPPNIEQSESQGIQKILWGDENFHMDETYFEESTSTISFDKLKIDEDLAEEASTWKMESIANEIALFRELLSEIDCKIGKLTLARLLMIHDSMVSCNPPHADKIDHYEEILELFRDLIKLDPPHSQYYTDEHSLVLLRQVTSSRETLLKHCYQYKNSTSNICDFICLRLNNFSLTRMGSIQRLLWVQMLDLSHNELQSIEGLEAMQLLLVLNLSSNKLCTFTALDPLRPLTSLKVLDISHNEIGAHSIDTKRYLCPSPLSHTVGTFNEISTDDLKLANYWEAYLIFKGLNLTQLDLLGNALADERLESFLIKILQNLRWLNGKELQ